MFNKPHTVLPRVSVFDQDSLRRMTNMATDVGKAAISYASAPVSSAFSHDSNHPPSILMLVLMVLLTSCSYATRQLFATPVSSTLPPSSQSQETQEKHRFSNHLHAVVAHPKTTQKDVPSPASPHHMVDELTGTTIRLLGPLDFANYLRRQYPHLVIDLRIQSLLQYLITQFNQLH